jgi:hypothetical protein
VVGWCGETSAAARIKYIKSSTEFNFRINAKVNCIRVSLKSSYFVMLKGIPLPPSAFGIYALFPFPAWKQTIADCNHPSRNNFNARA